MAFDPEKTPYPRLTRCSTCAAIFFAKLLLKLKNCTKNRSSYRSIVKAMDFHWIITNLWFLQKPTGILLFDGLVGCCEQECVRDNVETSRDVIFWLRLYRRSIHCYFSHEAQFQTLFDLPNWLIGSPVGDRWLRSHSGLVSKKQFWYRLWD